MRRQGPHQLDRIADADGKLVPNAREMILATMAFPAEAAALMQRRWVENDDDRERMQVGPKAGEKGLVAGELLTVVRTAVQYDLPPHSATVGRAADLLTQRRWGARTIHGDQVSFGRSFIMEAWAHSMPVAHLWAALLPFIPPGYGERTVGEWLEGEDALRSFLGFAEALREWGEAFRPYRARADKPLLRGSLQPPRHLALPVHMPHFRPLPAEEVAFLVESPLARLRRR